MTPVCPASLGRPALPAMFGSLLVIPVLGPRGDYIGAPYAEGRRFSLREAQSSRDRDQYAKRPAGGSRPGVTIDDGARRSYFGAPGLPVSWAIWASNGL